MQQLTLPKGTETIFGKVKIKAAYIEGCKRLSDYQIINSTQGKYMMSTVSSQTIIPFDPATLSDTGRAVYEQIISTRITNKSRIKRLEPVVTVAGSTYARRGDFSVIMGQRKAGKTTVLQSVAATALMENISPSIDTLQIKTKYCEGKAVIYIDTEGSEEDTEDFREGVKRVTGFEELPENFYSYHWRKQTQKECREWMEILFKIHSDSHIWIIDGIADLVTKPNDEAESNETVRWIMNNAGRLNTCIVVVIHENPAKPGQDTKARGHLGSELERKASGAIAVEKNREEKRHYIKSRFLRKSEDFDPIVFWFDQDLKRPVSRLLTSEEKQQLNNKDYYTIKDLTLLRDRCFLNVACKSELELKGSIELYQDPSPTKEAARKKRDRNIKALLKHNLIWEKTVDKQKSYYPISTKKDSLFLELTPEEGREQVCI